MLASLCFLLEIAVALLHVGFQQFDGPVCLPHMGIGYLDIVSNYSQRGIQDWPLTMNPYDGQGYFIGLRYQV